MGVVGSAGSAGIPLREGVLGLMQQCRDDGVPMGIATTTSQSNVEALLLVHLGERSAEWFAVAVCGDEVQRKKPHSEVYLRALQVLGISQHEALAIEDSPAGVAVARSAGIPVMVTRSAYFADATMEGTIAVGLGLYDRRGWQPSLGGRDMGATSVGLADIRFWLGSAAAPTVT